jgi:hypothetical protein
MKAPKLDPALVEKERQTSPTGFRNQMRLDRKNPHGLGTSLVTGDYGNQSLEIRQTIRSMRRFKAAHGR